MRELPPARIITLREITAYKYINLNIYFITGVNN